MNQINLTIIESVLLGLLFFSWLQQILFLIIRVRPLAYFKAKLPKNEITTAASVIICAKNEAENLKIFLPGILTQNYPDYKVIVVNDCSEDDTEMVLATLKIKYPKLYYTNIPLDRKFIHGKKLALTIGIKAATSEHIVLTDADCHVTGPNWLRNMMQGFENPKTELVLGFSPYEKSKGFTNLLTRYDTFYTAIQYLGFALSGKPYMGVGRNMAYKKELFLKNNGLKSHSHLASGDDDLFVRDTATKENTAVVINNEAQTISIPPTSLRQWKEQKSRHLTTSGLYKNDIKWRLATEPFCRLIFWAVSIGLIIFNTFVWIAAGAIFLKTVTQLFLWGKVSRQLNQPKINRAVILFEWLHPLILLWALLGNFRRNKKRWK
jgi:glycosyltransferase involved in cell wall biosynthesis